MPDKKILLKSLSANPITDTVVKKTTEVKLPEEDAAADSTYLGKRRTNFMLKPGTKIMKGGQETGRMFQGVGDYAGKTYVVHQGSNYAQELGGGKSRDVELSKLHEEHQAAIKNREAEAKYDAAKSVEKAKKEAEENKPMSDENVSKLASALKSMKKP